MWTNAPEDITLSILCFITPKELTHTVGLVSQCHNRISRHNFIWEHLVRNYFGIESKTTTDWVSTFRTLLKKNTAPLQIRNRLVDLQGSIHTYFHERTHVVAFPGQDIATYYLDGYLQVDACKQEIVKKTRGIKFQVCTNTNSL